MIISDLKSKVFGLSEEMKIIVRAMMKREGRSFQYCEVGKHPIEGKKGDIHHEKYEGATYRDLKIACRKCNNAPENKGLA